jgi:hypothetical protein
LLFNYGNILLFTFISSTTFLIFLIYFLNHLKIHPPQITKNPEKKENYFLTFVKYFIFIIILTNFVFIGTIGIHEFGHFSVSKLYDCEYRHIVIQEQTAFTELLCQNLPTNFYVLLGGILLPFFVAFLLFISGGKFIKEIAILMTGFNLLASYKDLSDLGLSDNIILTSIILGILTLILGIALLAKSKTEEYPIIYS